MNVFLLCLQIASMKKPRSNCLGQVKILIWASENGSMVVGGGEVKLPSVLLLLVISNQKQSQNLAP